MHRIRQLGTILLSCIIGGVLVGGVWAKDKTTGPPRSLPDHAVNAAVKSDPHQAVDRTAGPTKLSSPHNTPVPEPAPLPAANPAVTDPAPASSVTPPSQPAAPGAYGIVWQSVNSGGVAAFSANYEAGVSVGQGVTGYSAGTTYAAGAGYWYGAVAGDGCACPFLCDFDANAVLDPIDLNGLIDALFFAGPNPTDPGCPATRGDFDYSGDPDPLDLNDLIDHLFFAGPPPVDPCQ